MYKIRDLIRMFVNGHSYGKCSRAEIVPYCGFTILIHYGWAVLGIRDKTGKIIVCKGWHGYSTTTSKYVNYLLGHVPSNAIITDSRVEWGARPWHFNMHYANTVLDLILEVL